jgi:WhiB family transcriptional regulator, redox-sensing transcriptional regulator
MSAPQPRSPQARLGARLWSLINPPELPLFVPTEPTPCHGDTADPEKWHDYRRPGPAIEACHTCYFIGRCGWNAIVGDSAYGVWAGVQLPGGTNPQKLKAVREQLLEQFDRRRHIELGIDAPIPPRPTITGAITQVTEEAESTVTTFDQWHAFDLDTKIRRHSATVAAGVDTLLNLMRQAAEGQIHIALGFKSLSHYFADAVRISPSDPKERKLMATAMSNNGMSTRAIASALGCGQTQVRRDLKDSGEPYGSPGEPAPAGSTTAHKTKDSHGRDGKHYPRNTPTPDMAASRGQAKVVENAHRAIAKTVDSLEAAFGDLNELDADVNPKLLRELAAGADRIGAVVRDVDSQVSGSPHLSSASDDEVPDAVIIPMHRTVSAAISVGGAS